MKLRISLLLLTLLLGPAFSRADVLCDARPDLCDETATPVKKTKKQKSKSKKLRRPASVEESSTSPSPSSISLDSYLSNNAVHPALKRRPASQQAFTEIKAKARKESPDSNDSKSLNAPTTPIASEDQNQSPGRSPSSDPSSESPPNLDAPAAGGSDSGLNNR